MVASETASSFANKPTMSAYRDYALNSGLSGLSNNPVIHCCSLATIDEWPLFESEAKRPDSGAECPSVIGFA
jgi:hypothetical protein